MYFCVSAGGHVYKYIGKFYIRICTGVLCVCVHVCVCVYVCVSVFVAASASVPVSVSVSVSVFVFVSVSVFVFVFVFVFAFVSVSVSISVAVSVAVSMSVSVSVSMYGSKGVGDGVKRGYHLARNLFVHTYWDTSMTVTCENVTQQDSLQSQGKRRGGGGGEEVMHLYRIGLAGAKGGSCCDGTLV